MEKTYTKRIRVKFDVSTKGVVTPSVTCEMIDTDREVVLVEAGKLLKEAMELAKFRQETEIK